MVDKIADKTVKTADKSIKTIDMKSANQSMVLKPMLGVSETPSLANKLDLSKVFDVLIIGCGAAGLGALMYASRYKLNALAVCQEVGGASLEAVKIENYLGFKSISGPELIGKFKSHAELVGGLIVEGATIESVSKDNSLFIAKTYDGRVFKSKTVVLATGTMRRRLKVPGEERLSGKGVSYCATCDAPFYKNKIVAVVGGGDAAVTGAVQVADHANKVYLLVRSKIRAEPVNVEALEKFVKQERIVVKEHVQVSEILGEDYIKALKLNNGEILKVGGLFVEIGGVPNTKMISDLKVDMDHEYVKVDKAMRTSLPGFYAAGDVTDNPLKQDITAAAEGAIAAFSAYSFLKGFKHKKHQKFY